MFEKILEMGKSIHIFYEDELYKIVQFSDHMNDLKVINFDKVKEILCSAKISNKIQDQTNENVNYSTKSGKISFKQQKSCDAIKFIEDSERIDFIEGKRFTEFMDRTTESTIKEEEKQQIEKLELQKKIIDSLSIFNSLIYIEQLNLSKEEITCMEESEKVFILLLEFGNFDFVISKNEKKIMDETSEIEKFRNKTIFITAQKRYERFFSLIENELKKCNLGFFCGYKILNSKQISELYGVSIK